MNTTREKTVSAPQVSTREGWWIPLAVAIGMVLLAVFSFRHGQDFGVYHTAVRRFLGGQPLYPDTDGWLAYRYAPGAALVFAPFAPLPLPFAKAFWLALSVALSVYLTRKLPSRFPAPRALLAVGVAFLAMGRPLLEEIQTAQINLLVLILLLVAFQLEDSDRPLAAGLFAALAVGLKLAPVLLAVDWALRRRWRPLAGLTMGLIVLAAAPIPFYGLSGTLAAHQEWVASLQAASKAVGIHPGNQSIFALVARLGLPAVAGSVAALLILVVALLTPAPEPRRSQLLFCLALCSSYGWMQNYVFALPAVYLLARQSPRLGWLALAVGLPQLLLIYDIAGPRWENWAYNHSAMALPMLLLFSFGLFVRMGPEDSGALSPSPHHGGEDDRGLGVDHPGHGR